MINEIEEVQWAYLLDPAFELTNTAGKPLTDGYIEVYIHGTRNKYYCSSDFDGTLHPFKIPLDALGANIILASPAHAYDVYVYNKFGSLVMSRYNVQPKLGAGEIAHDNITVSSEDNSVQIITSGQTNYDLSIQDTIDRVDVIESNVTNIATSINEISDVVSGHDIDIEDLKSNKKDKQEVYVAEGSVTKTITRVEQDENGKMTVTYSDIDLPSQVPNVELTSPNGTINIASSIDVETNTKTFEIDIDGHEPSWHYWTANNEWTNITNSSWKDINRPNAGSGSAPHSWIPEIKTGIYDAKADFTVTFHNPDNTLTVPNQIIQIGFRAKLVGKNNADAIKYIELGSYTYDPSLYTTEPYQYNFAQESIRQNYSTSKLFNVPAYVGDTEYYIYYQAALLNTDGGVNTPQPIDPICKVEITYFGYHEIVSAVNGNGTGSNLMPGSGISIDEDRINVNIGKGINIIDNELCIDESVLDVASAVDNLATSIEYIQEEIDNLPEQVQSDWAESNNTSKSYIRNKPEMTALVEGNNITITASGNNVIISSESDVTKADLASAIEILESEIPTNTSDLNNDSGFITSSDIANLATKTELSSAVDVLQNEIDNIPGGGTYTQGDGISISNGEISVDNTVVRTSDLTSLATKTELGSAIDELASEINNIPAQVQANWTEADNTSKAYIQNKPSIPTKTSDLNNDSGYITSSALNAYIPYSASGVDLPNSNFEIGVDGQAYKKVIADVPANVVFENDRATIYITETNLCTLHLPEGTRYIQASYGLSFVDVQGASTYTFLARPPYIQDLTCQNNYLQVITLTESNFSCTIPGIINHKYVLEDDLASAIDELASAIPDFNGASGINVTDNTISLDDPMYVKAGNGIVITATGDDIIISSNGGGGQTYTPGVGITFTASGDDVAISTTELASGAELVAGSGINIEEVDGNVRISANCSSETRTLLYTGSSTDARSGTFTLSQSAYNFDRIELTCIDVNDFVIKQVADMPDSTLVNANGTRGSWFNSVTSGSSTWFKAMNWQVNQAGTTLSYWVDEIATSGNSVTAINRNVTNNRPIMLRIYGYKTNYGA